MKGAAVVVGGVLLAGCVTEAPPAEEAVSEAAPMTAEGILAEINEWWASKQWSVTGIVDGGEVPAIHCFFCGSSLSDDG